MNAPDHPDHRTWLDIMAAGLSLIKDTPPDSHVRCDDKI